MQSNKMWGGRFKKNIDKGFFDFQKSIPYDYKLARYDILHSRIHVQALVYAGLLSSGEAKKLQKALGEIQKEVRDGKFRCDSTSEDIHTEIQNRVEKKAGSLALKLHTLRSRNDQIVFDEKFYCFNKAIDVRKSLVDLLESLLLIHKKYKDCPFIGYTHTQRAQVISFQDYLGAFHYMFERDSGRITRFVENLFVYIGAGALAGSSLKNRDYDKAIKEFLDIKGLKKVKPVENSLDNVSDRDFIIELLSILSIIQMHLSRLAEDFILYSTKEFNFIDLPEEFCTGSSMMPHKKNPDFLELVRGYTGRIYGNLISVLTTMKGLPLTYNRDMQLDKEPLFSSVEIIKDELEIMARFIRGIKLNEEVIKTALEDKTLYATELAEWLVREQKAPFKKAHDIVGRLIILAEKKGGYIERINNEELKNLHPALSKNIIKKIMNPKYAISSKKTVSSKIFNFVSDIYF